MDHAYSTDTLYNELPKTDSRRSTVPISPGSRRNFRDSWHEIWSAICQLVKNTRYVFIVIANLFEGVLLKGRFSPYCFKKPISLQGFVPFITKYFEYQHQLDTSTATLITGAIALLSVIIGCPLGAFLMNKYSWTPMQCARICTILFLISSFLFLFLIFSCPELTFQHTSCSSINTVCCHNIYHPGKSFV